MTSPIWKRPTVEEIFEDFEESRREMSMAHPSLTATWHDYESTSPAPLPSPHRPQSSGTWGQPVAGSNIPGYNIPPIGTHSTVNNNSFNITNSMLSNMNNRSFSSYDVSPSSDVNTVNYGQHKGSGFGTQTDNNSHNTTTFANSVPLTLHKPKIETLNIHHHVHRGRTSSLDGSSLYSSPSTSQLQSPSQIFTGNASTSQDTNMSRTAKESVVAESPASLSPPYRHQRNSPFLGDPRACRSESQISSQHVYLEPFGRQHLPQHIKEPIHVHILAFMRTQMLEFNIQDIPIWDSSPSFRSASPAKKVPTVPTLSTQVGDVGFFNGLGGFHTIFNIFASVEENKARGLSPPQEFSQFKIEEGDMLFSLRDIGDSQIYRCSNLVPDSVQHGRSRKYTFTMKGSKKCQSGSAIVVLGGGHHTTLLPALRGTDIEKYISTQILNWYNHAKILRGNTSLENGGLLLISSTYNVQSCGMVTMLANDKGQPMTAALISSNDTGFCYRWDYKGGNFTSHVRPTNVVQEDGTLPCGPSDHCIGVQALSIKCPSIDWKRHFRKTSNSYSLVLSIPAFMKWKDKKDSYRKRKNNDGDE